MNYLALVKNSSIYFSLKSLNEKIFLAWQENAEKSLSLKLVLDTAPLREEDLINNIATALESLAKNYQNEKITSNDAAYSYVCTYIQSSLNALWVNKFLVENCEGFFDLMKLKSVLELLSLDEEFQTKIDLVYEHFLQHKHDAISQEENLPENVVSLVQKHEITSATSLKHQRDFQEYFGNLFFNEYLSLLRQFEGMFCPPLTEYLDAKDFEELFLKIPKPD